MPRMRQEHATFAVKLTLRSTLAHGLSQYVRRRNRTSRGPGRQDSRRITRGRKRDKREWRNRRERRVLHSVCIQLFSTGVPSPRTKITVIANLFCWLLIDETGGRLS